MKKLLKFKIALVGSIMIMIQSCYYDEILDIEVPLPDVVSFQNDLQPILNANCVVCHSGNTAPDLRDGESYSSLLNGYVVPGDAEASILYKSLLNLDGVPLMPPVGNLSDYDISLVQNWIDNGAQDN
jgi:hypothetical protein